MPVETYLDEACLHARHLQEDFVALVDLLDESVHQNLRPRRKDDLWEVRVSEELNFTDLLFSPGTIDHDIQQALARQILGLESWDTDPRHQALATRDFAVGRVTPDASIGCMVLRPFSSDPDRGVLVLSEREHFDRLLRAILFKNGLTEDQFIELCTRAYRNLLFKPGIAAEIRRFSRAFPAMRNDLAQALADLNDYLPPLFADNLAAGDVQRRFQAASTFRFSLDSPKTRADAEAMRERQVVFNGQNLRCEWHLKFEYNRDRIHVCPVNPAHNDGRTVFVGIFAQHLKI